MPSQIKIQQTFLAHKIWQVNSKTYMEKQKAKKAKTILKEKNEVVWFTLPDVKTYYKATIIVTIWNWNKIDK